MPKVNITKGRVRGSKNSPISNKGKIKNQLRQVKSVTPTSKDGHRKSKRLQQQKITDWSQKTKRSATGKISKEEQPVKIQKVDVDANSPIESKTVISVSPPVAQTSVKRSYRLDKLNREEKLNVLKNFDLEGLYGPCRGISRRSRFERALTFRLQPAPEEIIVDILDSHPDEPEFERCIWDCNELLRVKLGSPLKKGY